MRPRELIKLIENGVMQEDGTTRNFDVFDFYDNVKMDLDSYTSIVVGTCTAQEVAVFKVFAVKHLIGKELRDYDIKTILDQKIEIGCEHDKKGNLIPGSGKVITNEEKLSLMLFMTTNNIPLNTTTYRSAFSRYKKEQAKTNKTEKTLTILPKKMV